MEDVRRTRRPLEIHPPVLEINTISHVRVDLILSARYNLDTYQAAHRLDAGLRCVADLHW